MAVPKSPMCRDWDLGLLRVKEGPWNVLGRTRVPIGSWPCSQLVSGEGMKKRGNASKCPEPSVHSACTVFPRGREPGHGCARSSQAETAGSWLCCAQGAVLKASALSGEDLQVESPHGWSDTFTVPRFPPPFQEVVCHRGWELQVFRDSSHPCSSGGRSGKPVDVAEVRDSPMG